MLGAFFTAGVGNKGAPNCWVTFGLPGPLGIKPPSASIPVVFNGTPLPFKK